MIRKTVLKTLRRLCCVKPPPFTRRPPMNSSRKTSRPRVAKPLKAVQTCAKRA